jgi:signal peptidase I
MFHFMREMTSALVMALIAIIYVIQAFKIPSGSMENSLLVGDFLLGLKFVYGAPLVPFSQELGISQRLPAFTEPKPGDVIIFKYPGNDKKDYIKRCVAGPGQTVEIDRTRLLVDGKEITPPPRSKYINQGLTNASQFSSLRIPAKGDIIKTSGLPLREFLFFKHLVHQENPTKKVIAQYDLYLNGVLSNDSSFVWPSTGAKITLNNLNSDLFQRASGKKTEAFTLNAIDNWTYLNDLLERTIKPSFTNSTVELRYKLFMDGLEINEYKVKFDNYFMMGDNRDNSLDSRYWGYLNRNYIKAKAFILYFSLDEETPYWALPLKIRWNRIGKLIRSWDGVTPNNYKY